MAEPDVSESTLTQRLRAARRTLGDSGQNQHFIKTVHGRGYRFIAAVEEKPGDTTGSGVTRVAAVMATAHACPACQHANPSGEVLQCLWCPAVASVLGLRGQQSTWGGVLQRVCHAVGQPDTGPNPYGGKGQTASPPRISSHLRSSR